MWSHYGGNVRMYVCVYCNAYPNGCFCNLKAINNLYYCTIDQSKGSLFLWYSFILHLILYDLIVRISSLSLYSIFILYSFVYMFICFD